MKDENYSLSMGEGNLIGNTTERYEVQQRLNAQAQLCSLTSSLRAGGRAQDTHATSISTLPGWQAPREDHPPPSLNVWPPEKVLV